MEFVYLDSALLAIPNFAIDESTAQEIVNRVLHFADLCISEVPVRVVIASGVEDFLWERNLGPGYTEIEDFLELMGIGHVFTARDLSVQYQTILERAIRAQEATPVEVIEYSDLNTQPELPQSLFPGELVRETGRVLATVAAIHGFADCWNFGSAFYGIGGRTILVQTKIERAFGNMLEQLGELPISISQEIRMVSDLREMISDVTARRMWDNAETAADLHFSIYIGALAIRKSAQLPLEPSSLVEFKVGPDFVESLQRTQCWGRGRFSSVAQTLCSQIVSGTCQREVKAFGRPQQQVRDFDNALGWRVHLTSGELALRLMFWRTERQIELANIGAKHELWIARGRRGAAISVAVPDMY